MTAETAGGDAPPPVPAERQRHLDVREDIRAGREPFERIMAVVRELGPADAMVLRVPFEPRPLYAVLAARGLAHRSERLGPGDWRVWFYAPEAAGEAAPSDTPTAPAAARAVALHMDVRGLEPPGPMLRVLECAEGLGRGQVLEVVHDRRPLFLYPQLEARGLRHHTVEEAPGVVRIRIQRPA
jgi:uncharacterized protein (DUF2249 family)